MVTAEFTLGPEFSGVPRYVHGGVVLAILDEAMAWAAIAVAERFAVVHQTATTFDRPVRVGRAYRVTASVQIGHRRRPSPPGPRWWRRRRRTGRRCAEAHARLVVMTAAEAASPPSATSTGTRPLPAKMRA